MFWRSWRYQVNYAERWRQRFGFVPPVLAQKVIWVHAVSMGEP